MNTVLKRNNVKVKGQGPKALLFAHGFGCDQHMWRLVAPAFEENYQVILFDHVGSGYSDLNAYDPKKYSELGGYADDIIEIIQALALTDIVFIGHSVAAMMGVLAAIKAPALFSKLILVGPSPYYINESEYQGGFSKLQIDELLESLDDNHLGWSMTMAPVIMGNPDRQELGQELAESFCRTDPAIAKQFARTTFLSDTRAALGSLTTPTLILQCSSDVIAPSNVGAYVHKEVSGSEIVYMEATGHCPNLSAPEETVLAIKQYLEKG